LKCEKGAYALIIALRAAPVRRWRVADVDFVGIFRFDFLQTTSNNFRKISRAAIIKLPYAGQP
jgi:hypothetical protein